MSRNLLILALLVSGTGCSATRPLLSTIVVTPPRLSFRQMPREDLRHWTAVGVTYPSESLIPAPCAPSPVHPGELVAFFEEDAPSLTPVVSAPPVDPALTAPAIVHQDTTSRPESAHLPVPSVAPVSTEITPIIQAALAVSSPSEALTPLACAPSPVRPVELVAFIEEDNRLSPLSLSGPVPLEITSMVQTASTQTTSSSTLPAPPVRLESPPPSESDWKPTTSVALVSPVQPSPVIGFDQAETAFPEDRPVMPVESLPQPVIVPSEISDLLAENRNQRQLIEALQRDLTRERSADDAAIEELEAAVENLLVHTETAQRELPTTRRK